MPKTRTKCGLEEKRLACHELSPNTLGTGRHSWQFTLNKAELGKVILKDESIEAVSEKPENMCQHRWPGTSSSNWKTSWDKNFGDLAEAFPSFSCLQPFQGHMHTGRHHLDRYRKTSIKNTHQQSRSSQQEQIHSIIENIDVPLPIKWKQFIDILQ